MYIPLVSGLQILPPLWSPLQLYIEDIKAFPLATHCRAKRMARKRHSKERSLFNWVQSLKWFCTGFSSSKQKSITWLLQITKPSLVSSDLAATQSSDLAATHPIKGLMSSCWLSLTPSLIPINLIIHTRGWVLNANPSITYLRKYNLHY